MAKATENNATVIISHSGRPTGPKNACGFLISDILFCTSHGSMSKRPAKFFSLTSAIPNANFLPPADLVAAAETICANLPKDDEEAEL